MSAPFSDWPPTPNGAPTDRLEDGSSTLFDGASATPVAAGERIEPRPGEVIALLEGAVERRNGERLVDVRQAPALLGLGPTLAPDGAPRFELVASTDASIARRPREALGRDALARALEDELARRDADAAGAARRHDELFERGAGARVSPGPYRFGPFEALAFVVHGAPADRLGLLPPGLLVAPGLSGVALVVVSFIEDAAPIEGARSDAAFGYQEVATFIPCVSRDGRAGMYAASLFPDATMPILLGRELYGFPKRLGRIVRRPDGVDLYVGHRRVMRASHGARRSVELGSFGAHLTRALLGPGSTSSWVARTARGVLGAVERTVGAPTRGPRARIFADKRIPSEAPTARPEPRVHELIEVPFSTFGIGGYAVLDDVAIELDPATMAIGGVARAGVALRMGFEFGDGRVARDHRAAPRWWERRAIGGWR